MCKFKSNAETRYLLCVSLLRLSATCVRPGSDFGAGARSSRQSRPRSVVEHVRPDAIDASSRWRGLLGGVEGEAAAWSSRVGRGAARRRSGPMRDDQRFACIEAPGPARRSRTDRPETRDYVMRPPRRSWEPDLLPSQEPSMEGSPATEGGPPPRLPPRKRAFRNGNRPYPLRLERSASHTHISAVAKQVRKRVAIATPDRSTRSPAPTHPLHPPAQLCALKSASDAQFGAQTPLSPEIAAKGGRTARRHH